MTAAWIPSALEELDGDLADHRVAGTATDEQAAAPNGDTEVDGDSIAYGFGTDDPETQSWPAKLAAATGCTIHKRAVNGSFTSDVLDRLTANPGRTGSRSIFGIGRNDCFYDVPLETTMANIAKIVGLLNGVGREQFMFIGAINARSEPIGNSVYNRVIAFNEAMAAVYPDNFYDIRPDWLALSSPEDQALGLLPEEHFSVDALHPNTLGTSAEASLIQANCTFPLTPGPNPLLRSANLQAIGTSPCVWAPGAKMNPRATAGGIHFTSQNKTFEEFGSYDPETGATVFPGQVSSQGILAILERRDMLTFVNSTAWLGDLNLDVLDGETFLASGESVTRITVKIFGAGVSISKSWELGTKFAGTGGIVWQRCTKLTANTGPGGLGDDFELDIIQFSFLARFRLRRISGSTPCAAHVNITCESGQLATWTRSTITELDVAPPADAYLTGVPTEFPGPLTATNVFPRQLRVTGGTSVILDAKLAGTYLIDLTSPSCAIGISNLPVGAKLEIILNQGFGGNRLVTWSGLWSWSRTGLAPTLSTADFSFDVIQVNHWTSGFFLGTYL